MTGNIMTSTATTRNGHSVLKISLEFLWLAAIGLTPLVFVSHLYTESLIFPYQIPKVTVFRLLIGIIVGLFLLDLRNSNFASIRSLRNYNPITRFSAWLKKDQANWITCFAIAYLVSNITSTAFSGSPRVSLWGKDPGAEGYSLYNIVCYFALWLVLLRYLKNEKQIFRLVITIVISGWLVAIYSSLQYFNLDPLGIVQTAYVRPTATMGNALFVANFLLLTAPLTLALLIQGFGKLKWVSIFAFTAFFMPQLLGLFVSLGRSAIISYSFSVGVFLLLVWVTNRRKQSYSLKPFLAIGVFFVVVLGFLLSIGSVRTEFNELTQPITDRLGSTYTETISGTMGGRIEIWQASSDLLSDRPWFPFEENERQLSRHVVGYGPDLFHIVFPLRANVNFDNGSGGVPNYAHNHFIHTAVELGFLGFISYLGLIVAIFVVGISRIGYVALNRPNISYIFLGSLSALSGYTINMITGIPRISDLVLFWCLVALLLILCKKTNGFTDSSESHNKPQKPPAYKSIKTTLTSRQTAKHSYVLVMCFILLSLSVVIFSWQKNANYFSADRQAYTASQELTQDYRQSLALIDNALALAPDLSRYYDYKALILREAASGDTNETRRVQTLQLAIQASEKALDLHPYYYPAKHTLAFSTLNLSLLGQEQMKSDAIKSLKELTQQRPNDWRAYLDLASAYIVLGEPHKALETTTIVSSMLRSGTGQQSLVPLYNSLAYQQLGDLEQAFSAAQLSRTTGGLTEAQDTHAYQLLGELRTMFSEPWLDEFSS
ncbi:MAG: hypothetical protein CL896_00600 [Dehalococcoidia bacterium]|nr:hypothetical protein [Dehalococcoidia bacterium]|tara:strand:- start:13967 stop:16288 length:2322 start_codon:yes stop_codon:yes gene_type:complete